MGTTSIILQLFHIDAYHGAGYVMIHVLKKGVEIVSLIRVLILWNIAKIEWNLNDLSECEFEKELERITWNYELSQYETKSTSDWYKDHD